MAIQDLFNYLMPVFSFLLVYMVIYVVLTTTKVLGDNNGIKFFVSLIIASFFIANSSLANFVQFNAAWVAVFIVSIVMVLLVVGAAMGKVEFPKKLIAPLAFLTVLFFVVSSSYVFAWTFNWETLVNWAGSDWFSLFLILVVAGAVAFVVTKAK
jgi:hypothetical protein